MLLKIQIINDRTFCYKNTSVNQRVKIKNIKFSTAVTGNNEFSGGKKYIYIGVYFLRAFFLFSKITFE